MDKRKNSQVNYSDRYNYVDRSIYSGGRRPPDKRRRKKRGGAAKRVLLILLAFVLVCCGGVFAYFKIMTGRLDRTDDTDASQYEEQPSAAPSWSVISDDKVTNILLIGMDKGEDGKSSRSDTAMLVSVDNKNKKLRMVSFLRDMYVEIPQHNKNKLNAAFSIGGQAMLRQTIENNFRVNIDKYVAVDFEIFEDIVNRLGGVDINMNAKVAAEENKQIGSHLKEGVNHLTGAEAMYYVRIRHTDSDFGRTGRQRQMLQAIIAELKKKNFLELQSFAYDFLDKIKTNLSDGDITYLLSIAGPIMGYDMETMSVPYKGTYEDAKVKGIGDVLEVDLVENSRLLREFLYGADSTSGLNTSSAKNSSSKAASSKTSSSKAGSSKYTQTKASSAGTAQKNKMGAN